LDGFTLYKVYQSKGLISLASALILVWNKRCQP
jgi:hypothetical protein